MDSRTQLLCRPGDESADDAGDEGVSLMAATVPTEGRYVVEDCTDSAEWNSFVERNDGPAYTHWGWSEAVASYGHDHWHLVARDRDTGTIRAGVPLYHVRSRLFGSQLLSPAFAERGAVVTEDAAHSADAERALLDHSKRLADVLDVDFLSLRGARRSTFDDFDVENRYVTFQVAVDRGRDAVWDDVSDSRQRQVEQAADDDALEFRVGDSVDDLRMYYRLYLETMQGHGSPPHSFEFFRTLWDQLHGAGNLKLGMILHDGSLINGIIDLPMGSTVYQWGVVNDYERRDLNGGSLILWKSLAGAADNGYDTYEFGRTREGSGVYMFKKSYGGSKAWYDDLHYFPNDRAELPDPEDSKYELATEVWKRLPLSVVRVVGPHLRKRIGL